MTLQSVMIQLQANQIERLDRQAKATGRSRSAVIRDAVDVALADDRRAEVARQYERAYNDHPFDEIDEWGSIDEWHRSATEARAQGRAAAANTASKSADPTW